MVWRYLYYRKGDEAAFIGPPTYQQVYDFDCELNDWECYRDKVTRQMSK